MFATTPHASAQAEERVDDLISAIDAAHARVALAQRELFSLIADMDRCEAWRHAGARDLSHWLCMRYGISSWKAHRWIAAAHALEQLPRLAGALAGGDLGIDKVVELCRFASPETEGHLIRWAKGVSCATVRRRADIAALTQRITDTLAEHIARAPEQWWGASQQIWPDLAARTSDR